MQALFRALKTKGNTPKYGIIYHSTFIGRAAAKNKGRISRVLANKCSIASRIDRYVMLSSLTGTLHKGDSSAKNEAILFVNDSEVAQNALYLPVSSNVCPTSSFSDEPSTKYGDELREQVRCSCLMLNACYAGAIHHFFRRQRLRSSIASAGG